MTASKEAINQCIESQIDKYKSPLCPDVTAWGDTKRQFMWGLNGLEEVDGAVKCDTRFANKSHLKPMFDEASFTGRVIVWKDSLPDDGECPASIRRLIAFMEYCWDGQPPFIKVDWEEHDPVSGYHYSIKPVWELTE